MPLKPFSYPDDTRLLGYLGCVYKFKLHFSASINPACLPEIQDDIELAIDHILVGIPKCIKSIRTKSVTISFRMRQWSCEVPLYDENGKEFIPFSHSYKLFICTNEEYSSNHVSSTNSMNEYFGNRSFSGPRDSLVPTSPTIDVEGVSPSLPSIQLPYKKSRFNEKSVLCRESPRAKRRNVQSHHIHEETVGTVPRRKHRALVRRVDDSENEDTSTQRSSKPDSKMEINSRALLQKRSKDGDSKDAMKPSVKSHGMIQENSNEFTSSCVIL